MPANDITDFLLKEYDRLSQAYFEARDITAKWVKYYLIIMAAPFSFIAFMFREKPLEFDFSHLPDTLSILMILVGTVGLFLAFIIIESAADNILYARAVNGIRKAFLDRESGQELNWRQYIILPDDIKKPRYLGWKKTLWITTITGLINSCYLSIGVSKLYIWYDKSMAHYWLATGIIWLVFFIGHLAFYILDSQKKEEKYG